MAKDKQPRDAGGAAPDSGPCPIVAVGASAGGLEAFKLLLQGLPTDLGVAIVLVQHLAAQHESELPRLLQAATHMPVAQVVEGMPLQPDHVYVIPPNTQMAVEEGRFRLSQRPAAKSRFLPIDHLFASVARYARSRAIAVILSGTASDGAAGLHEIKRAGGIALAQSPETAAFDGMPRAAIATGDVDLVLAAEEMGGEIARFGRHPLARADLQGTEPEPAVEEGDLSPILALLRHHTGVDFTHYKRPTIQRRLHRRMLLNKIQHQKQYIRYLHEHPAEVERLYRDLLIHVTHFFRDPESFEQLATLVFPQIAGAETQHIRIWVPGCATGEEAYSVAMVLLEHLGGRGDVMIQIFGTDLSDTAIDHARAGVYPEAIEANVSPERLRRFFVKWNGAYRVSQTMRDLCIFARQDLTRDPPFSRLDLVVCRNVLIYLGQQVQKRLMGIFHYALKPDGFLMLGGSETAGHQADLFSLVDKKHRIYRKKPDSPLPAMQFPLEGGAPAAGRDRREARPRAMPSVFELAERFLLDHYAPAGVLIDSELNIVNARGQTGPFLELAPGAPSLHLLKMARGGLLHPLRALLHDARDADGPLRREHVHVAYGGADHWVDLQVIPIGEPGTERHFLVLFEPAAPQEPFPALTQRQEAPADRAPPQPSDDARVRALQAELAANRDYLQSVIHDLEATNQELQSANEEILSSNEELQSTNEELDTAKEELQSANEELNTINDEIHARNEELSRANSDLVNLLASVQIAIVMVTAELRIRRYTPMAEKILNLIPSDVGRPITQIKPNIDCPDLEALITRVIDDVAPQEREVQDRQGRWLALRVRPYKDFANRIDGAVLTLFDVDLAKRHEQEVTAARNYAEAIVDMVREPLMVLGPELRIRSVNKAFGEKFKLAPAAITGKPLTELDVAPWRDAKLTALLHDTLAGRRAPEVHQLQSPGGRNAFSIDIRRIDAAQPPGEPLLLVTAHEPVGS
jgi:two-component system, chemotaxis family, CheB/CheR fusion protein